MINNTTKQFISASFILSTALMPILGAVSPAEAATRHCRNVKMVVTNNAGQEIKITDIDYYDPDAIGDWRSEPIGSHKVDDGESWEKTRRLEKVNGQNTHIRVEYKLRDSDGDWGWTRRVASTSAVCSHGSTYSVTVLPPVE